MHSISKYLKYYVLNALFYKIFHNPVIFVTNIEEYASRIG